MADNELMVLIYETLQKQLNQFKDSRVVTQTLCNRMGELEKTVKKLEERTKSIEERLSSVEEHFDIVKEVNASDKRLTATINAMRGTLDTVTNPGITLVGNAHKEIKDAVRELSTVHQQVMDEFEQYELRLVRTEDYIQKLMTRMALNAAEAAEAENEDE